MATATAKAELLDKLILNENIYIYKKATERFYPKRSVKELFDAAIEDKQGQGCKSLFNLINDRRTTGTGIPYRFSALVLKYTDQPTFLREPIAKWVEQKLAYLFLLDFGQYLILVKRNISGINSFLNSIDSLDYEIIAKLFIHDSTLYEKFSLQNLDISSKAMRSKAVESDNLVDNYNYIGSNTYIINHLRLNNDNQRYQISLNTSKISKAGDKISIDNLANWCYQIIEGVEGFEDRETFLDIFAKPCNYEKERQNLEPITVTILFSRIFDEILNGKIRNVQYEVAGQLFPINLVNYVRTLSISIDLENSNDGYYKPILNSILSKGLKLTLHDKSIRLNSKRLRKVILTKEGGGRENLVDYLNQYNCFVVNFNDCELVYSNKKLFKDSSLLGSIDYFMEVFSPDARLGTITSEKGNVLPVSNSFDNTCVFGFVEAVFDDSEFLVLDDLGDEWADHIAISGSTISFIHSKESTAQFSATAFTDIVGQAQKNIGNMFAVDGSIRGKKGKWEELFRLDGVQSAIPRLRKGASVDECIAKYVEIKHKANPKRKLFLALNFISKQVLRQNLTRLRNGEAFAERRQAIQILWFISSLIASCRDNSIELTIYCKP